jgi:hypothetical protein
VKLNINRLLIYTDPANDPYSDAAGGGKCRNTDRRNRKINDKSDIGHLFMYGNAGCIGCVCVSLP